MGMRPSKRRKSRSRKPPQQDRSVLMVEAILDAGAELLKTRGLAACSTNRIAERAGVSIGSLYTYFADKDAVFSAVRQRLDRSINDEVSSAVRAANGLGPEASARVFLHATILAITARAGLYRTLVLVHPALLPCQP